jgi:hypothetical protein
MRKMDALIAAYLLAHGVIAVLVDCQAILPDAAPGLYAWYIHVGLTSVVQQWVAQQGDFLMGKRPLWFQAIVAGEVLLQVPLCFGLAFGWLRRREWVRLPGLIYGAHVLTTMVPIMAELCLDPRPTLLCKLIYAIWVVLPALVLLRCVQTPTTLPLFDEPSRTLWKLAEYASASCALPPFRHHERAAINVAPASHQ